MGCVQRTQPAVLGTRVAAGLKRGNYLQTHDNKTGDEWLMTDACKFKPEALGNNTTERKVGGNPPTFTFQIQAETGFRQRPEATALPLPTMAYIPAGGEARIRGSLHGGFPAACATAARSWCRACSAAAGCVFYGRHSRKDCRQRTIKDL